jgi:hypothetical protein
MTSQVMRPVHTASLCGFSAPFEGPVVPEVNMIMPGSDGSTLTSESSAGANMLSIADDGTVTPDVPTSPTRWMRSGRPGTSDRSCSAYCGSKITSLVRAIDSMWRNTWPRWAGLIGANTPPAIEMPSQIDMKSGRLAIINATTSPLRMPSR